MGEVRIKRACPYCGAPHDDATGIGQAKQKKPTDGAVAICFDCAEVSIFCNGGTALREPTALETAEIFSTQWQLIETARRHIRARRRG